MEGFFCETCGDCFGAMGYKIIGSSEVVEAFERFFDQFHFVFFSLLLLGNFIEFFEEVGDDVVVEQVVVEVYVFKDV